MTLFEMAPHRTVWLLEGILLALLMLQSMSLCDATPRAGLQSREPRTRGSALVGHSLAALVDSVRLREERRMVLDLKAAPDPQDGAECFRCDNGMVCLFWNNVCDGYPQCLDGSDEAPTVCNRNFSCAATGRETCPLNSSSEATRCIWPYQACNNVDDCPGDTEESTAFCTGYECSDGLSQCPSGTGCFDQGTLCDGYSNCRDGSDESESACKDFDCSTVGKVSCPAGNSSFPPQCVLESSLCNNYPECPGATDESAEFCSTFNCSSMSLSTCPSGSGCIDAYAFCDGYKDCLDGSDEDPAFCNTYNCSASGKVSCPEGPGHEPQCIGQYSLCNGTPQCPEASDEDPAFCATYVCPDGMIKCPERNNTFVWGAYCNGADDCSTDKVVSYPIGDVKVSGPVTAAGAQTGVGVQSTGGTPGPSNGTPGAGNTTHSSDEDLGFCRSYHCPPSWTKCGDRLRCIPNNRLCDGHQDCLDGSDESPRFCNTYNCTASGRVFCPSGKYCMNSYCGVCSGATPPICPDASDQWNSSCALKNKSQCSLGTGGGIYPGCTGGQPCSSPGGGASGGQLPPTGGAGTGANSDNEQNENGVGSGGTGKKNKRKRLQKKKIRSGGTDKKKVLGWVQWWKAHHKPTRRKGRRIPKRKFLESDQE